MERKLTFRNPSFAERIKGMLGVDFYRLFHTPMFYIFLAISAIIPAMVSAMTMMPDQNGNTTQPLYANVWQIIAASEPLYVIRGIADYANMNMVFIFGGIMVSIFIGHDYKSGYVKQLFTTHAKKQDYMISKSLTCAFAMACMCLTLSRMVSFWAVAASMSIPAPPRPAPTGLRVASSLEPVTIPPMNSTPFLRR